MGLMTSGIAGMQANQTALDVIGNNVANSSTVAFKEGRTRFQDMLSQNLSNGTMPTGMLGGTNPSQVGLGVKVAGIDTVTTQGNMNPTGRNLDAAIDGDGYFMVSKGPALFDPATSFKVDDTNAANTGHTVTATPANTSVYYTRDGAFTLDSQGNLLTSDGYRVLGYSIAGKDSASVAADSMNTNGSMNYVDASISGGLTADDTSLKTLRIPDTVTDSGTAPATVHRITSFSIGTDGTIVGTLDNGNVTALGQIAMASFSNPAGLLKNGQDLYTASANSGSAVIRTGVGTAGTDNSGGYGDILQGELEMSNVDIAKQFADMIVANRAFQANGKSVTTQDEVLQSVIGLVR